MRIDGRTVLITGAASGIGRAGALLFAAHGGRVAVADVDEAGAAAVVAEIREEGGEAVAIGGNLAERGTSERIVAEAALAFGGLDILWCNAGVLGPSSVENIPQDDYEDAVAVNMSAPIMMSAAALPLLRQRGGGSIIVTASTAGLVGSLVGGVYSATKFAVVGYVKSLAQRVAMDNIRVNALCPGPVLTPLMRSTMEKGTRDISGEAYAARINSSVPMGRLGDPLEIAHAALWLASDFSTYVTGIALPVDGGYTCR